MHEFTGWLRRQQLRLITATASTITVAQLFDIINWTDVQVTGFMGALSAWLAVATSQNVDTRALEELPKP